MKIVETFDLTEEQKRKALSLWNQEYPAQLMFADLNELNDYLIKLNRKKHYLLINQDNELLGWTFVFERENETWFAIILDSRIQRKGIGTKLIKNLQAKEEQLNGWVIDRSSDKKSSGNIYKSPINFYLKNGFALNSEYRLKNGRISAVKIVWIKN